MNTKITPSTSAHRLQWENAVVDGLIAGSAAGVIMLGYLALTSGSAPADLLISFAGALFEASPLLGAVAHLATSAIYGMVFGLVWYAVRGSDRLALRLVGAIIYALLLYAFSEFVLLPAVQSPLLSIPALHFGIGHALYGIVLGLISRHGEG